MYYDNIIITIIIIINNSIVINKMNILISNNDNNNIIIIVISHIFHIIGTLLDRNYIINLNIKINTFIMYLKIYFSTKDLIKISS